MPSPRRDESNATPIGAVDDESASALERMQTVGADETVNSGTEEKHVDTILSVRDYLKQVLRKVRFTWEFMREAYSHDEIVRSCEGPVQEILAYADTWCITGERDPTRWTALREESERAYGATRRARKSLNAVTKSIHWIVRVISEGGDDLENAAELLDQADGFAIEALEEHRKYCRRQRETRRAGSAVARLTESQTPDRIGSQSDDTHFPAVDVPLDSESSSSKPADPDSAPTDAATQATPITKIDEQTLQHSDDVLGVRADLQLIKAELARLGSIMEGIRAEINDTLERKSRKRPRRAKLRDNVPSVDSSQTATISSEEIRSIREQANLSAAAAARRVGITRRAWTYIESGKRVPSKSLTILIRLLEKKSI